MSERFQAMLDKMTLEEREQFVEMMKHPDTYFADDFMDVVAIINQLQEKKKIH